MVYSPNNKAVSIKITRFSSIGNGGGSPIPSGAIGAGGVGPAKPLVLKSKRITVLEDLFRKIFMFFIIVINSVLLKNSKIF
jgi:hypothetical protein